MASWMPFPGLARSPRASKVSLVQLSRRGVPAQGGVQGPALKGCLEEVGVADGGRRDGGVLWVLEHLAGWAVGVWRVYVDLCVFLSERGWSWRFRVVWWV